MHCVGAHLRVEPSVGKKEARQAYSFTSLLQHVPGVGGDLLEWLARCNSAFSTGPNAPFRPSPNSTSSKKPARCAGDVCATT